MRGLNLPEYDIVRDTRTLRMLERRGLIAEPPESHRPTGKKWGGAKGYYYVDEKELGIDWIKIGHFEYRRKYFDGCFFPLVLRRVAKETN